MEAHLAFKLVELASALRKLEQNDLDEVASTRLLIYAARMISSGMNAIDVCRCCLAEPLSDDPQTVKALMDVAREELRFRIERSILDLGFSRATPLNQQHRLPAPGSQRLSVSSGFKTAARAGGCGGSCC